MVREGEGTAPLPVSQDKSRTIPCASPQGSLDQRNVFSGVGGAGGCVYGHFTVFCGTYPALSVRVLKLIPLRSVGDRDGSTKGVTAYPPLTGRRKEFQSKCYEIA